MRFQVALWASIAIGTLPGEACDSCYGPSHDVIHTRHVRRMQPDALDAMTAPKAPLEWGQINFLQTTDTHGWLAGIPSFVYLVSDI